MSTRLPNPFWFFAALQLFYPLATADASIVMNELPSVDPMTCPARFYQTIYPSNDLCVTQDIFVAATETNAWSLARQSTPGTVLLPKTQACDSLVLKGILPDRKAIPWLNDPDPGVSVWRKLPQESKNGIHQAVPASEPKQKQDAAEVLLSWEFRRFYLQLRLDIFNEQNPNA